MRGNQEKRLQRVVSTLCATLFSVYAFLFVGVYQAPVIEVLYNHVATGKLSFDSYVVGGIISAVLTIFALWLNRFTRFQREWTAMAYLPSTLLLAFVTDIDRSIYVGGWSYDGWIVVISVAMSIYGTLAFVLKRVLFEKIKNSAFDTKYSNAYHKTQSITYKGIKSKNNKITICPNAAATGDYSEMYNIPFKKED